MASKLIGSPPCPGAKRIVSLAPSATDTVAFMGLGAHLVGVTEQCDSEEVRDCERIGTFSQPDVERICLLRPDLVLALGRIHSRVVDELAQRGVAVFVSRPQSVMDILDDAEEIARLGGQEKLGEAIVDQLRERVRVVGERMSAMPPVRVFRLMTEDPLVAPSSTSYQYDAVRVAGGLPFPLVSEEPYTAVPMQEVIDFDPQVIVSCGRKDSEAPKPRCRGCRAQMPPCQRVVNDIRSWEGWRETAAARDGRIYAMQCNVICRPGPGIVKGVEQLAEWFHPTCSLSR